MLVAFVSTDRQKGYLVKIITPEGDVSPEHYHRRDTTERQIPHAGDVATYSWFVFETDHELLVKVYRFIHGDEANFTEGEVAQLHEKTVLVEKDRGVPQAVAVLKILLCMEGQTVVPSNGYLVGSHEYQVAARIFRAHGR